MKSSIQRLPMLLALATSTGLSGACAADADPQGDGGLPAETSDAEGGVNTADTSDTSEPGTTTSESDDSGTGESGTTDSDSTDTETGSGQDVCADAISVPNASTGILAAVGDFGPSYETVNHLGEAFNPCQIGGGRPILLSVSTGWCGPCMDLAAHISGVTTHDWIPAGLKPMIDSGEVLWIEYMANDAAGPSEPTVEFMATWHDTYPHDKTIIAADWDHSSAYPVQLFYHLGANGFPSLSVLDADYRWAVIDADGELVLDSLQIVYDKLEELLG